MPRVCTVCQHPDRERIDELLLSSQPNTRIAKQFGLKDVAVGRHKHNHLLPQLGYARGSRRRRVAVDAVIASAAQPFDLYERVEHLHSQAQELLKEARTSGQYGPAVAAIRESTRLAELWAKVEGTLKSGTEVNVNVLVSPEWHRLRSALLDALRPHPEAARAVGAALAALEAGESSDTQSDAESKRPGQGHNL